MTTGGDHITRWRHPWIHSTGAILALARHQLLSLIDERMKRFEVGTGLLGSPSLNLSDSSIAIEHPKKTPEGAVALTNVGVAAVTGREDVGLGALLHAHLKRMKPRRRRSTAMLNEQLVRYPLSPGRGRARRRDWSLRGECLALEDPNRLTRPSRRKRQRARGDLRPLIRRHIGGVNREWAV